MTSRFWREQAKKQNDSTTSDAPGRALDRELAERIGNGDRDALAHWLDRHLGAVYGYLTRRLGPGQEQVAAEITRATFEGAMRHLKPYARGTPSTPMQLWLIRRAGNQLARRRSKAAVAPPTPTGESTQLAHLRKVMSAASPRKQAALSLALFEGMPAPDIAAALGTSQGRAMRLLRNALRTARPVVEDRESEDDRRG